MANINLDPYIFFKGNCREAMEFYKSVFGGELQMQSLGQVPADAGMSIDKSRKDEIMHARLSGGMVTLMGSDSQKASDKTAKVELSLSGSDESQLKAVFDKLSDGGSVRMPLSKQFWGDLFGMVTDKYGVDWMINIGSSLN